MPHGAERARKGHRVLLLGGSADRRAAVRLAVRVGGHSVSEATTPLEAIVRLQDKGSGIGAAFVVGNLGSVTGDELRAFLVDAFPEVRVVAAYRRCRSIGKTAGALEPRKDVAWKPSESKRRSSPQCEGRRTDGRGRES